MGLSVVAAAAEFPDRIALVFGSTEVTYSELSRRVVKRAAALKARVSGATPEHPVALVGHTNRETIETVLSLIELGAPTLLVHPRLTPSERASALAHSAPHVDLTGFQSGDSDSGQHAITAPPDDDRTLAILHTSGSTGPSRPVALSRKNFLTSARASEQNLGWQTGDRWLLCLPIAHVGGLSILTRCLLGRATVVVPDDAEKRFDAQRLIDAVAETQVTLMSIVPTQLAWLLDHAPKWSAPPSLRAILLGGAPAAPSLLDRARERGLPVLTTYGLTEACSQVTTQQYGSVPGAHHGSGKVLEGFEARIDAGEILVRGRAVARRGWLRTGDAGHLDDEGRLHVHGRLDDVIVTGGENVHPTEVEAELRQCAGVRDACVFGVPDETWGQVVAAALVGSVEPSTLSEHVVTQLAQHRRPRQVANLPSLCLNRNGKVDRSATCERAMPLLRPLAQRKF